MAEDIVGGYRLNKHIVTGQTSQVWEVIETTGAHRHFAMKMLLPEKARDKGHRALLAHEAAVGKDVAHPNIIKIVKSQITGETPFIVMEYFPAGNLRLRIMRKEVDFIKEHAHNIFKQAATGLAYMNAKGWVHRDIKPDNFLVNGVGDLRIIDLALAKRIPKGFFEKMFYKGERVGTRSYMSPEQIRCKVLDGRADVYSFGATCYEIVTGRPPFRADSNQLLLTKHITEAATSPQMHNKELTDEFSELVLKMLAKKKEERPNGFHEVLMKLKQIRVFKAQAVQRSKKE